MAYREDWGTAAAEAVNDDGIIMFMVMVLLLCG